MVASFGGTAPAPPPAPPAEPPSTPPHARAPPLPTVGTPGQPCPAPTPAPTPARPDGAPPPPPAPTALGGLPQLGDEAMRLFQEQDKEAPPAEGSMDRAECDDEALMQLVHLLGTAPGAPSPGTPPPGGAGAAAGLKRDMEGAPLRAADGAQLIDRWASPHAAAPPATPPPRASPSSPGRAGAAVGAAACLFTPTRPDGVLLGATPLRLADALPGGAGSEPAVPLPPFPTPADTPAATPADTPAKRRAGDAASPSAAAPPRQQGGPMELPPLLSMPADGGTSPPGTSPPPPGLLQPHGAGGGEAPQSYGGAAGFAAAAAGGYGDAGGGLAGGGGPAPLLCDSGGAPVPPMSAADAALLLQLQQQQAAGSSDAALYALLAAQQQQQLRQQQSEREQQQLLHDATLLALRQQQRQDAALLAAQQQQQALLGAQVRGLAQQLGLGGAPDIAPPTRRLGLPAATAHHGGLAEAGLMGLPQAREAPLAAGLDLSAPLPVGTALGGGEPPPLLTAHPSGAVGGRGLPPSQQAPPRPAGAAKGPVRVIIAKRRDPDAAPGDPGTTTTRTWVVPAGSSTPQPLTNGTLLPSAEGGYQVLVEFKRGRVLTYDSAQHVASGEHVIVGGDRGEDCGRVVQSWFGAGPARNPGPGGPQRATDGPNGPPLRVLRVATDLEVSHLQHVQNELEKRAMDACLERVHELGLNMELVDAEYQFDLKKLTFYYRSAHRQDFRELVRDLYKIYRARIWMEKIDD